MTNFERIKSLNKQEMEDFLFNAEFIRQLAYADGEHVGDKRVLEKWLGKEEKFDIRKATEVQYRKHKAAIQSMKLADG